MVRPDGSSCLLWLTRRPLPLDRVEIRVGRGMQRTAALRRRIDEAWKRTLRDQPRAFNGTLANLKGAVTTGGRVVIRANCTDYKTYSCLRADPAYGLFDRGIAVMGSSCVLVTGDRRIILARRGEGLYGAGRIVTLPGGLFTLGAGEFDLESHLREEAREELALRDLGEMRFHGIGYDAFFAKGAELLFSLRTPLSAAQVIQGHRRAVDRHEGARLFALPAHQAERYAVTHRHELLDGGTAALLAFAAHGGSRSAVKAAVRLSLREARRGDFGTIRALRNDATTVRFSKRGRRVGRDEYWAEVGPALLGKDRKTRLYIIEDGGGRSAGFLRYERRGSGAEVSIALAARARGRGLGTAALKVGAARAFAELKVRRIVAIIREENGASLKAFERAGFIPAALEKGLVTAVLVRP